MKTVLIVSAASLAALVVAATLLIVAHAVWLAVMAPRRRRQLAHARTAVVASLDGGSDREAADALDRLQVDLRIGLLADLATNLRGEQRQRLTALADAGGLLLTAEERCRSRRWWRRLEGLRLLTTLGGGETVAPGLLADPNHDVRAQAAEWAADHPEPSVIDGLLRLLGDEASLCRTTVQDSLLRIGARVADPLARFLATATGTACEAALEVAAGGPDPRYMEAGLALARHPSPGVRARAAALLGALGGPEAVEALVGLLTDPLPEARGAAARSLGTLGHWPAAPRIAALLRDPTWSVRRQAGLALRALGAPGELLLRRAVAGPDPFAADMARLLLELPPAPGGRLEPVSGGGR